jgi:Tol biopolymer transport system component
MTTKGSLPLPSIVPTDTPIPYPSSPAEAGTKIAFYSNGVGGEDIFVMNSDGSGRLRLTEDPAADDYPAFSKDGRKIAFQSNRDGKFSIFSMNADGSQVRRLTGATYDEYSPSWSADGGKIAFVSTRDQSNQVYVMNSDGSDQVRLTLSGGYDPSWSPDGSKIAFSFINGGIGTMSIEGTNLITLTNYADYEPAWSPDGKKIAFMSRRNKETEIFVMNVDGSGQTRLVQGDSPSWSPDGNLIAFDADGRNEDIYILNIKSGLVNRLTGVAVAQITKGSATPLPNCYHPSWSLASP